MGVLAARRRLYRQGDEGGAAWAPSVIDGCVLALQGNATGYGLGQAIAAWPDLMDLGGAAQATEAKRPLLAQVGTEFAAQFDAVDDWLVVADRDSLDFGTNDFSLVFRYYGDGTLRANCSFLNKYVANTDGRRGYILAVDGGSAPMDVLVFLGSSSITCWTTGGAFEGPGWFTLILVRSGANCYLYSNGVQVATAGSLSTRNCTSDGGLYICAQTGTWSGADIAVSGVFAFNKALSESERALIDAWTAG